MNNLLRNNLSSIASFIALILILFTMLMDTKYYNFNL